MLQGGCHFQSRVEVHSIQIVDALDEWLTGPLDFDLASLRVE